MRDISEGVRTVWTCMAEGFKKERKKRKTTQAAKHSLHQLRKRVRGYTAISASEGS
jgi:hypothetical protein